MARPEEEKEEVVDPRVAAYSTTHEEPVATEEEKDELEITEKGPSSDAQSGEDSGEKPRLKPTQSYATSASAVSGAPTPNEPEKKKWYKNLNPLRWSRAPPVPEEREVSREYTASFLSKLTFQWMQPMMTVSRPVISVNHTLNDIVLNTSTRLVTKDHSSIMISGWSILIEA